MKQVLPLVAVVVVAGCGPARKPWGDVPARTDQRHVELGRGGVIDFRGRPVECVTCLFSVNSPGAWPVLR